MMSWRLATYISFSAAAFAWIVSWLLKQHHSPDVVQAGYVVTIIALLLQMVGVVCFSVYNGKRRKGIDECAFSSSRGLSDAVVLKDGDGFERRPALEGLRRSSGGSSSS